MRKIISNTSKIFFTADTHFGHQNILRFCNRPFTTIAEHDRTLISNWNKTVPIDGVVFHLGDFAFRCHPGKAESLLASLNGTKILIVGNHDIKNIQQKYMEQFEERHEYLRLDIEISGSKRPQTIILCHYAFEVWDKRHHGSWHLHGHSHGNLQSEKSMLRYDVGVDNNNYSPISYEKIAQMMNRKEK